MKDTKTDILLINEEYGPILIGEECAELKPILSDFVKSFAENKDKLVEEWLIPKMQEQLPDRTHDDIKSMVSEIITTLETNEENKKSLTEAVDSGRSKESWFASSIRKSTSAMSAQEASKYLDSLDAALKTANDSLYRTITTQTGAINQNPNLDGFIAEQYHAQTFNMNAATSGSQYRAKVLESSGHRYGKNSVDVVIVDGKGGIVKKYQSKYCSNAQATERAFKQGDYRGQGKLVPEGQEGIQSNASTVIESPDGITSNSLTKNRAEQMRDEAQSGKWNDLNWNEYQAKDIAIGIGKQAGYAAIQGAAIGVGLDVAAKLYNGEKIEAEDVIETAITSGADFGIKAAAAGALKVGVEKEIISVIPKGTPAGTIANIAYVAIEDVKVVGKMATGELSVKEGIDKLEQTTVSTVAGLAAMGKGAAIGTTVGSVFGPVGAAAGGFVGGTIGYMAGSKGGETIVKEAQKIRDRAVETIKTVGNNVANAAKSITDSISNGLRNLAAGLFGF